jgi:hypothetical protein
VEGGEQCNTASQSGRLSVHSADYGSSRSSGDTIPVHPVTAYEQALTANALFPSSTGQLHPPLQGELGERTQALHPEGERDRVSLGAGVGPLGQAPAVLPGSLGATNAQEETSLPFLSSATRSENPDTLITAAQGLLSFWSQS